MSVYNTHFCVCLKYIHKKSHLLVLFSISIGIGVSRCWNSNYRDNNLINNLLRQFVMGIGGLGGGCFLLLLCALIVDAMCVLFEYLFSYVSV